MTMPGIFKTLVAGAGLLSGTAAAQDAPLPPPILLPAAPTAGDQPNVRSMFKPVSPRELLSVAAQAQRSQELRSESMLDLIELYPQKSPGFRQEFHDAIVEMIRGRASRKAVLNQIAAANEFHREDVASNLPAFKTYRMVKSGELPSEALKKLYFAKGACTKGSVLGYIARQPAVKSVPMQGDLVPVQPKAGLK